MGYLATRRTLYNKPVAAYLNSVGLGGSTAGADFEHGLYWLPQGGAAGPARWCSQNEFFGQYTCADSSGVRTYFDAAGIMRSGPGVNAPRFTYSNGRKWLLLENATANLLLNSGTLNTQTVTVTATAYTLSFYGTGTVVISGTGSGTLAGTGANNRVSLTFTPTAGALILTVTGTVTNAQLENQSLASSYIATAGTAVTRPIETFRLPAAAESVLASPSSQLLRHGGLLILASVIATNLNPRLLNGSGGAGDRSFCLVLGSASKYADYDGSHATVSSNSSISCNIPAGFASSTTATTATLTVNQQTPTSGTFFNGNLTAPFYIAKPAIISGPTLYGDGIYNYFALWPTLLSSARLQAIAVPP